MTTQDKALLAQHYSQYCQFKKMGDYRQYVKKEKILDLIFAIRKAEPEMFAEPVGTELELAAAIDKYVSLRADIQNIADYDPLTSGNVRQYARVDKPRFYSRKMYANAKKKPGAPKKPSKRDALNYPGYTSKTDNRLPVNPDPAVCPF